METKTNQNHGRPCVLRLPTLEHAYQGRPYAFMPCRFHGWHMDYEKRFALLEFKGQPLCLYEIHPLLGTNQRWKSDPIFAQDASRLNTLVFYESDEEAEKAAEANRDLYLRSRRPTHGTGESD